MKTNSARLSAAIIHSAVCRSRVSDIGSRHCSRTAKHCPSRDKTFRADARFEFLVRYPRARYWRSHYPCVRSRHTGWAGIRKYTFVSPERRKTILRSRAAHGVGVALLTLRVLDPFPAFTISRWPVAGPAVSDETMKSINRELFRSFIRIAREEGSTPVMVYFPSRSDFVLVSTPGAVDSVVRNRQNFWNS